LKREGQAKKDPDATLLISERTDGHVTVTVLVNVSDHCHRCSELIAGFQPTRCSVSEIADLLHPLHGPVRFQEETPDCSTIVVVMDATNKEILHSVSIRVPGGRHRRTEPIATCKHASKSRTFSADDCPLPDTARVCKKQHKHLTGRAAPRGTHGQFPQTITVQIADAGDSFPKKSAAIQRLG
jgi:hypothetical protein